MISAILFAVVFVLYFANEQCQSNPRLSWSRYIIYLNYLKLFLCAQEEHFFAFVTVYWKLIYAYIVALIFSTKKVSTFPIGWRVQYQFFSTVFLKQIWTQDLLFYLSKILFSSLRLCDNFIDKRALLDTDFMMFNLWSVIMASVNSVYLFFRKNLCYRKLGVPWPFWLGGLNPKFTN